MFAPTTTNIIACLIKYEWNMEGYIWYKHCFQLDKTIHNVHNTTHDTCWLLPGKVLVCYKDNFILGLEGIL
jgi:hypothetical protein